MFYVHESLKDEFFDKLKLHMTETYKENVYAKIINKFHADRILGYLRDHGGSYVIGSGNFDEKTNSIERTVILNP